MSNQSYSEQIFNESLILISKYRKNVLLAFIITTLNLLLILLTANELLNTKDSKTFANTSDGRVIEISTI